LSLRASAFLLLDQMIALGAKKQDAAPEVSRG